MHRKNEKPNTNTPIANYIKGLIRNHRYLTVEDIMLYLERYYSLPIKVPGVYYRYKRLIRACRQEVYRERRKGL
ncbi:MAG: hypothetical protein NZL90_02025 [Aquificaceae bacterium]|nr:hypothetical protein [Aquificaceae bacterium]MDW8237327.1 hypothetical protein [Aquificaceae bacterium]